MILALAIAAVMAQDCHAMLPAPDVRIEWFRNGRPYAVDEPSGSTRSERRYRRVLASGSVQSRTLTCNDGGDLVEQTASGRVVIPLNLQAGGNRRVGSATVQRIQSPAGATSGSIWFYISHLEAQRIGVRAGIGIEEVHTLGTGSAIDVLFGRIVRVDPNEGAALRAARAEVSRLETQIRQAAIVETRLRDSIRVLRIETMAHAAVRDTLRAAHTSADVARRALDIGTRMLADSAAALPSSGTARAAALTWPGAGQLHLRRGGSGWALIGGLAVAGAITALALPADVYRDNDLDPDVIRTAAVAGSAAVYIGALLHARSLLDGTLAALAANGATRESFLRNAAVVVSPDGAVRIVLRATR